MRTTIRISRNTLAFAATRPQQEGIIKYERYPAKAGISPAANLRQAFTDSPLLSLGTDEAVVMVDAPVSLIPAEEYSADKATALYKYTFPLQENEEVLSSAVTGLNAVALFAIPRDLRVVVGDHFRQYTFMPIVQPVWNYLLGRSFSGTTRKLFAYFHDRRVEVMAFRRNRFEFCNAFDATHCADAAYFLLNTWKQLGYDSQTDELYIVGGVPYAAELDTTLGRFLNHIQKTNPLAGTDASGILSKTIMPFDVQALYATTR